ncbi:beta-N-acetylhexosaminidase [Pseudalkalibacillus berkeleyi]|uniref:Beta-N-acetylhexosaminidase n=1 Tax=Pseudalkalibacillus berkeleyi TaxID=1069813 RepID=A0ABS9H1F8_9BACL|nr:beta-N-acetylhexosaminidase [Pseudalkalibacillus berkeleyi]MCF6137736.1 beta-N-acetylhexosaminidase [Pseudalkalibacillus berkeleyi]
MDLREKIGQLMVFGFKADHPEKMSDEIKDLIENHHVGGIILFGRNIGTTEEIQQLTSTLQSTAKNAGHNHPLFICIDQENGVVRRLGEGTTVFPGAMLLGATGDEKLAYEVGKASGQELMDLGINWNLAPVVDVNNNPNNPVIDVRSFGENPNNVAQFGTQLMKGMQASGVITTLKHFPGHGDTAVDSHLSLPVIPHALQRLHEVELVSFKEGIENGAETVMSSHVYFPSIEPEVNRPATMSKPVMTGLLREDLGFEGVITTDCMEMKAIADGIGTSHGAVEAIKAGVDLIMVSHLPELQHDVLEKIYQAVTNGEIEEKTIDEAYARVMKLKSSSLKWNDNLTPFKKPEHHQTLAEDVMRKGITLLERKSGLLPLTRNQHERILVIYPENGYLTEVEDERFSSHALGELLKELNPGAKVVTVSQQPEQSEIDFMKVLGNSADIILVGTLSATRSEGQQRLMQDMMSLGKPIIHIAMRSPYDIGLFPKVDVSIATYEFTTPALRLAVRSLFGLEKVEGSFPVTIPNTN